MNHSGSYPRHDSMMSSQSSNSSYQSSSSTVCTTPTQPPQSPIMVMSPVGSIMLSPRYRDNSTALIYTFEQMVHFMWHQYPSKSRGFAAGGSYTNLATGQTFTHDQMMAITRPQLPGQSIQSVQHQFQPQLQQSLQQQVHTSSNGHIPQPRTYQQMMPLQQQHIRHMQQVHLARRQGQMMQQTQMLQTQGKQWIQHSLPQQQIQPRKHLSCQNTNTGQTVVADQYGHQWTQEQYREMLRRRQLQMAQLSAAVSPILQQQGQSVPQVSPLMTASQRPIKNAARPPTPWPRAELLQRQQLNIRSSQISAHPRAQEQRQPALPVMPNCPQQRLHSAPSNSQLAQKHLAEIIRVRQAQKSVLPPSKTSNGAKAFISAKPNTQPAAYKQGVRKPQKQPRPQPAPISALSKTSDATKTILQTNTVQVKPISDPVTPKSCNSTTAPPIHKSDMLPPPVPSGPRSCPSNCVSTPASPNAAASRHSPYPAVNSPHPSTPWIDVDPIEVESDDSIQEELSQYLSDCYKYISEEHFSQNSVPGGNGSCLSTPQPGTVTSTTAGHDNTPTPTPTHTSNTNATAAPTSPTTATPSLSAPFSPSTSRFPRSTSPHNILAKCTFSLFTNHQELRDGAYPGFTEYHDPHVVAGVVEPCDPERAPEERSMSEERAQLEWEMMVMGDRYAGDATEENGEGEKEEGE